MDGSAERIYQAAVGTPADHSVIFLAHNGPTGVVNLWAKSVFSHDVKELLYIKFTGNSRRLRFQYG